MENAETTAPVASRQRAHRSAVSNGTRLFCVDGLDGRSQTARRFRDHVETIGDDLGGTDHIDFIRSGASVSCRAAGKSPSADENSFSAFLGTGHAAQTAL